MSIRKTRSSLLFNSFSAFVLRQVHSSSAVTEHLLEVFLRVDFNERLGIALNAFKECKNLLPKQRQIANKTSDSFINYNEQTNGEVRLWAIMWRAFPTSKHHMWKLTTTRTLQIRFVPLTLKAPAGETWAFFFSSFFIAFPGHDVFKLIERSKTSTGIGRHLACAQYFYEPRKAVYWFRSRRSYLVIDGFTIARPRRTSQLS